VMDIQFIHWGTQQVLATRRVLLNAR